MKMIVVCGVTHWDGMLKELEFGLMKASIPLHVEKVDPMPLGPNSMTMRRKVGFVREMAQKFRNYSRIVVSDGWDVLFMGTLGDLPERVMISAEANCYPEEGLETPYPGPWRFVNAGLMSGSPKRLTDWCDAVEKVGVLDQLDQKWLNRCIAYDWMQYKWLLDWKTGYFYTVAQGESNWLAKDFEGPLNLVHRTRPCFFHFSGKTDPGPWKRLMGA